MSERAARRPSTKPYGVSSTPRKRPGSRRSRRCCGSPASQAYRSTQPTASPPPEFVAADLRAAGMEHVEVCETGGHPVGLRRLAPCGGQAHRPRICPLRRAAGGPRRSVGVAAVRAGRQGREDARPRCRGRQMPRQHAYASGRGVDEDAGCAPRESQVRHRGRGGVQPRSISTTGLGNNRERLTADFASSRTRGSSKEICRPSRSACVALVYLQLDVTGSRVDLHSERLRGCGGQSRECLCQPRRRLSRDRTVG